MAPKSRKSADLRFRSVRLATFTEGVSIGASKILSYWTNTGLSPDHMADGGFHYTPTKTCPDQVTCFWCGKKEKKLDDVASITELHLTNNARCPFSRIVQSQALFVKDSDKHSFWQKLRAQPGLDSIIDPVHSASVQLRHATFKKFWALDSRKRSKVTSRALARAGFYYNPTEVGDDRVICMYCDCPLSEWDPDDNPIDEHKKNLFTYCYFLDVSGHQQESNNGHNKSVDTPRLSLSASTPVGSPLESTPERVLNESMPSPALHSISHNSTSISPHNSLKAISEPKVAPDAFDFSFDDLERDGRDILDERSILPKRYTRNKKAIQVKQEKLSRGSERSNSFVLEVSKGTDLKTSEVKQRKEQDESTASMVQASTMSEDASEPEQENYTESFMENTSVRDTTGDDPSFEESMKEDEVNSQPVKAARKSRSQFSDDEFDDIDMESILNSPKKGRKIKVLNSKNDSAVPNTIFDLSNQNIGDYDDSNVSFFEKSAGSQKSERSLDLDFLRARKLPPKSHEQQKEEHSIVVISSPHKGECKDESISASLPAVNHQEDEAPPPESSREMPKQSTKLPDSESLPQEKGQFDTEKETKKGNPLEKPKDALQVDREPTPTPDEADAAESTPISRGEEDIHAPSSLPKTVDEDEADDENKGSSGRADGSVQQGLLSLDVDERLTEQLVVTRRLDANSPELNGSAGQEDGSEQHLVAKSRKPLLELVSELVEESRSPGLRSVSLEDDDDEIMFDAHEPLLPNHEGSSTDFVENKRHPVEESTAPSPKRTKIESTEKSKILDQLMSGPDQNESESPSEEPSRRDVKPPSTFYKDYVNNVRVLDEEVVDVTFPPVEVKASSEVPAVSKEFVQPETDGRQNGLHLTLHEHSNHSVIANSQSDIATLQSQSEDEVSISSRAEKGEAVGPEGRGVLPAMESEAVTQCAASSNTERGNQEQAELNKPFHQPDRARLPQAQEKAVSSTDRLSFGGVEASTPQKGELPALSTLKHLSVDSALAEIEALEETIEYLAGLKAQKLELHCDTKGDLTDFIASMPEEEEELSISDWIKFNASTCRKTVEQISENILSAYEAEFNKIIDFVENIEEIED